MEGLTNVFLIFIVMNSVVAIVTSVFFYKYFSQKAFVLSLHVTPIIILLISVLDTGGLDDGFAARILLSFILAWPVIAVVESQFKHYQQNRLNDLNNRSD